MIWRCRGVAFDFAERPLVMGILNVTPDSFSDGGRYLDPGAAVARGHELFAEGADLLDLGAESTRPGSPDVPAEEQWRRLEPVLTRLRQECPKAMLSVDTRSAEVARRALALGAQIVNDVSALGDPAMAPAVAAAGAGLVLMHMRGTPATMQRDTAYEDVVTEVREFLLSRLARAQASGVAADQVALDPGIGFGKSAGGSLELLSRLPELAATGRPILVGASRKSFLARLTGDEGPPEQRVPASLAAAAIATFDGAHILRVHDVAATVRVVQLAAAARKTREAHQKKVAKSSPASGPSGNV